MLLHDNEVLSMITTENKEKIQKGNPHPSLDPQCGQTNRTQRWLAAFAQLGFCSAYHKQSERVTHT
jgi:hypothetical protein